MVSPRSDLAAAPEGAVPVAQDGEARVPRRRECSSHVVAVPDRDPAYVLVRVAAVLLPLVGVSVAMSL